MKLELKIIDQRIDNEDMRPKYQTAGACAIDLRACTMNPGEGMAMPMIEKINLYPTAKVKIGAGFAIHLRDISDTGPDVPFVKLASLLIPRSGLGSSGIVLSNTVGLIDSDYQGEVIMAIENRSNEVFIIEPLVRLAQMMIVPCFTPEFEIVEEFTETTERGAGGFNSTGNI